MWRSPDGVGVQRLKHVYYPDKQINKHQICHFLRSSPGVWRLELRHWEIDTFRKPLLRSESKNCQQKEGCHSSNSHYEIKESYDKLSKVSMSELCNSSVSLGPGGGWREHIDNGPHQIISSLYCCIPADRRHHRTILQPDICYMLTIFSR